VYVWLVIVFIWLWPNIFGITLYIEKDEEQKDG